MKSSLKLAALAALSSYVSAKEIEMDAEVDAALYKSGAVHEKIMQAKEVRSYITLGMSQKEKEYMLIYEATDILG